MPDLLNIIIGDEILEDANRLNRMCRTIPGIKVTGQAHSRQMLLAKLKNSRPDLLLLSPGAEMGKLSIIEDIRKIDPDLNIILVYDPDIAGSDDLVAALEMGVAECMKKIGSLSGRDGNELRLRLLTMTGLMISRKRFSKKKGPAAHYKNRFFMPLPGTDKAGRDNLPKKKIDAVVIASSTGGPEILSRIFSILPGTLNVPILLVQHIPVEMSRYFAKSLNRQSELNIRQADHGDRIQSSTVYIAPGGQHMMVSKPDLKGRRVISLNEGTPVNSVRPSADVLFESAARSYNGNVLAVVLTGMGEDGKNGVAALKDKGCICLTQNAQTCVVYGMPRAVDEAGLSDESLDPLTITQRIAMLAS